MAEQCEPLAEVLVDSLPDGVADTQVQAALELAALTRLGEELGGLVEVGVYALAFGVPESQMRTALQLARLTGLAQQGDRTIEVLDDVFTLGVDDAELCAVSLFTLSTAAEVVGDFLALFAGLA